MSAFRATYYDGLSSQGLAVEVSLDEFGSLRVLGHDQQLTYPLAVVRIAPRLANTTRSLVFPDGSKCESNDHEALDALERATGRGKAMRLVHRLESRWRFAVAAAALLFGLGLSGTQWGIPFVARRIAEAIPPRMAYDLGRGTLEILDHGLLKPSELALPRRQRLKAEFAATAQHYPSLPLTLEFRSGIGANAFALPDGTVVVTDELVKLSQNDFQILAVLAHEIGHVHHRHSLRMALESSTVVLLLSAYLGDVTQLTTLSSALPGVYAQARYSRAHETEADSFALHYLDQSGIPHRCFAEMLRALQKSAGADAEGGMQYLASHPPTSERIQRFER